eukprot:scaffold18009_cov61-Phaeocystis_antarctica.AAC.4
MRGSVARHAAQRAGRRCAQPGQPEAECEEGAHDDLCGGDAPGQRQRVGQLLAGDAVPYGEQVPQREVERRRAAAQPALLRVASLARAWMGQRRRSRRRWADIGAPPQPLLGIGAARAFPLGALSKLAGLWSGGGVAARAAASQGTWTMLAALLQRE